MRLFIDMDGTLARFHAEVNYLEQMYEQGFFMKLKPFEAAVDGINSFCRTHPQTEVFILSSCVDGEPPYCRVEKDLWIDKYLPCIDKAHRLFPNIGTDKYICVPGGVCRTDFLYDDYNKNLEQWQTAGGVSVKCKNDFNHKGLIGELWRGRILENCGISADEFSKKLFEHLSAHQRASAEYEQEI